MKLLWKTENVNYLIENYHKRTAAEIAMQLKTTRNSVIGKANRMGLSKTNPQIKIKPYEPSNYERLRIMEDGPIGEYQFHEIAGLPMCKWPLGKMNGVQTFCGKKCKGPYCDTHQELSVAPYQPSLKYYEKFE